jgi:hypothetical protein
MGNSCLITQEEAHFVGANNSNNSGQQQGMNFNNIFLHTLKDLVYGQKQINDNISKIFLAYDKTLESLARQLEGLNSIIKN